jgi:flagellar biosynthesis chaperone FliJ
VSRFRYPLRSALALFSDIEQDARRAFAAANEQLAVERAAACALEEAMAATRRRFTTGPAAATFYAEIDRRVASLERTRCIARERAALASREVARARAELERAAQQREALERHRARARAKYVLGQDRREAAELDEANARRTP